MSGREVPPIAQHRLKREYMELMREPVQYIEAHPTEHNLLEWHYVLYGPPDTPYADGIYHGRLDFPPEFPFKPPSIRMMTPSGRFRPNTRICLNISDYHPESWSAAWTIGSVLVGLLSFMVSEDFAAGVVLSNRDTRLRLAKDSWRYNLQNPVFCKLFPSLAQEARLKVASNQQSS